MEKRRGFPPKTPTEDDGVFSVVGKTGCKAGQAESPPGQRWERPPVALTSGRRVGSPDWQRGRRRAQKGRGTRKGGGASVDEKGVYVGTAQGCWRGIGELLEREKRPAGAELV